MADTTKSIVDVTAKCFDFVRVYSDGIWNIRYGETVLQHSFVRFQVQLLALYGMAHLSYLSLKRFHLPRLTSDVLGGLVFGPAIFGKYFPHASELLFPPFPNQVLASLLKMGYILFTFLAAVRLDVSWIRRIGKKGFIIGALLFIFPFTMTLFLKATFEANDTLNPPGKSARENNARLYLSTFITSQFVDVSAILMQLKITNSRLGHLALATTILGDLGKVVLESLQFLDYRVLASPSVTVAVHSLFYLIFFMFLILGLMRPLCLWFIKVTPQGQSTKDIYVKIVVILVLYLASLGDNMGLNYLWGPFLLGLVIPAGSPLASTLTSSLDTIVHGLLVPLLSTFCATQVNVWGVLRNLDQALNFQMALICYAIKLLATYLILLPFNLTYKEAVALTLILNVKGTKEMGTILSFTVLQPTDLDSTSGVLLVFLLTTVSPPLIKLLYDPAKHYIGYKKKCIQHTPYDGALGILVCARKQKDAVATLKLLELSNPRKQNPMSIYGLCLEELVGSDAPLLIDHQLGQKKSSTSQAYRSKPIIDIFKYFNSIHKKSAQVNIFTGLSPLKQMHEDICWLAFDKACSLIIIPFHKKWSSKGKMVSNNNDLRNLNINVLQRAPCSVAILIDRRKSRGLSSIFTSSSLYRIAVLFIGGADDREALCYALRMARNSDVEITTVRFVTNQEMVPDAWEKILDDECLRTMKQEMATNLSINYVEEAVRDGADTGAIVNRTIQGNYDLIMVGRRQDSNPEAVSGLAQWTELPELGPIGDILASPDITSAVSVLVMQQQILKVDHSNILN